MPLRKQGTFKGLLFTTIGVTALALSTAPANAALLGGLFGSSNQKATTTTSVTTTAGGDCPELPTTKAFAKYGDTADYSVAPGGDFEGSTSAYAFTNAKVVTGNDTLGILPGTKSIALGGGVVSAASTLTTPAFCVDQSHPYFRYTIKANGPIGLLATYVKYTAADGTTTQSQVQSSVSTSLLPGKWKASNLNPLSINIPLVANGGKAAKVQLVFVTPMSVLGAGYNIDNIMVDPYRRG